MIIYKLFFEYSSCIYSRNCCYSYQNSFLHYPIKPGLSDLPLTFWTLTAAVRSKKTITFFSWIFRQQKEKWARHINFRVRTSSSLFYLQFCSHSFDKLWCLLHVNTKFEAKKKLFTLQFRELILLLSYFESNYGF